MTPQDVRALNPLLDLDPTVYSSGFSADAEIRRQLVDKGATAEEAE